MVLVFLVCFALIGFALISLGGVDGWGVGGWVARLGHSWPKKLFLEIVRSGSKPILKDAPRRELSNGAIGVSIRGLHQKL